MKKIKFFATVMAVALVLFPLGANTLKVSAAEPTTFAVKYIEENKEWRFLADTSDFDEDAYHRELYYLYEQIKDGDIVVVYNDVAGDTPPLELGDTALSNLTVVYTNGFTLIHCGRVEEFYTLANTSSAINAPYVAKASVYDNCVCNFNCNVGTINFYITEEVDSVLGCSGTVDHFYGYSVTDERVDYDFYNFKADTFRVHDGGFQTPASNYSTTPTETAPTPAPAAPSTSGSASSGSDYDDVPKTGERPMAMWLLFAAALCAGGSYLAGKKEQ